MTFIKNDAGKPDPSLLPPRAVLEVVKVLGHGAARYGRENWRKCEDEERYLAAAMRHILAFMTGEVKDPDSGLAHIDHAAASLLLMSELMSEPLDAKFEEGGVEVEDIVHPCWICKNYHHVNSPCKVAE